MIGSNDPRRISTVSEMIERVAAAIANRRAGRRGAPAVSNVLEVLRHLNGGKLYDEVMDDARAVIEAMREPTEAMVSTVSTTGAFNKRTALAGWKVMLDAALRD
jgi:hypothetical protein